MWLISVKSFQRSKEGIIIIIIHIHVNIGIKHENRKYLQYKMEGWADYVTMDHPSFIVNMLCVNTQATKASLASLVSGARLVLQI